MQNTFSPRDSLGRSIADSQTIKSTGQTGFLEDSGKLLAIEEVLRKLVSVCLLANLVAPKIEYGDELLKRLLETKVNNRTYYN
jgi:hypothetical protein